MSIGLVVFMISLIGDYFYSNNTSMGPVQLLGVQIGVLFALVGLSMTRASGNQMENPIKLVRSFVMKVFDIPIVIWVLLSFLGVYLLFFIFPMYLNSDFRFHYFYEYLPAQANIGVDIRDGMWFVEKWLVFHRSPYDTLYIVYPPLFFILYAPLVLLGFPAYYIVLVVAILLFFTITTLCVPWLSNGNRSITLILFVLGLFSYGLQFELERGQSNIIAVSLVIIAVYIYHYHNKFRYWAYLLFTLGVQIKIYPVIFIVMLIKDWRNWAGNIRRIGGIALVNFCLLFVLGFDVFYGFLQALTAWGGERFSRNWSNSILGFVHNIASEGFLWIQPKVFEKYTQTISLSLFVFFGLCLVAVLVHSYIRNESRLNPDLLLICAIGALIIPSVSYDYKLPILIAPVSMVFSRLSLPSNGFKRILSILFILLMSTAYWSTQYPPAVKPEFMFNNVPAHFMILLSAVVLNFLVPWARNGES